MKTGLMVQGVRKAAWFACGFLAVTVALAQVVKPMQFGRKPTEANGPDPAKEAARAERRKAMLQEGWAVQKTDGKAFQVLDAAGTGFDFSATATKIERMSLVPVALKNAEAVTALDAAIRASRKVISDGEAAAALTLWRGDATSPTLSVFPEDRIAALNVARLLDGVDKDKGQERISREIWRALAFIGGGVESDVPCVTGMALTPADLDSLPVGTVCPPVAMRVTKNAKKLGFATVRKVPYRVACIQGWAPAPTNDAQRAVWEKARSRARTTEKQEN